MLLSSLLAHPRACARCLKCRSLFSLAVIALSSLFIPAVDAANNPVPFVDIVSPVSITPGSTGVTLTVRGTGFVSASAIVWNGTSLTTTFVSSIELTGSVPDALVAAVGLGSVAVVSPAPGGGKSGVIFVPVAAPEASTSFPSTPTSSVSVGTMPQGLVTADFNADGKLDLAVANNGSNNVSILLGNGDGTFTTKSTPSAGSGANWLAVGDFNEDGKLDLAVANLGSAGTGGISILLGNGDGTFTLHSSPNTGSGPFSVVAGDFNGDGHLDLAVSNQNDGTVTILLGHGDGTFTSGGTLTVGSTPQVIVAGDFNEDDKIDLAVSNESDGTVSVLLGIGNGSFQSQAVFSTAGSGSPIGLIAADFNRDGHLGLAAVNASDVAILLGNGNGSFTLKANPGTGTSDLIAGVTGDYNGDGKLDIVVSDRTAGQAFLFPGVGDGTFGTKLTFTTAAGAFGVATADFNGDGGLDLAVANGSANNVSIFLQLLPVDLNPTSLSFGNILVGSMSSSQAVTLTNSSGSTLNFTSINFSGANSGDFSQTDTCGASILNNTTCTIHVTFAPTATGARVATLTIVDNASNSPQTLAVSGGGTAAPTITSANNTTFDVGVAGTFTVTTTGFPAPSISETGMLPAGITFVDNGNGTATLAGTSLSGTDEVDVLTIAAHNGVGSDATQSFTLTVASPPTIAKAFGAATIPPNGTTSLTFTITNPNLGVTLTGIAFTDSLPAGLVVATPNNLSNTCGGVAAGVAGSSSVSLSSVTVAPSTSCTVSVNVTATTAGVKNNSVQATSTHEGAGNTSNASITVVAPPTISKAFSPTSIVLNAGSTLSFTITNPNTASTLSGVGFTDNLPAGVVVATPPNVTGSCGSGTITATAGTSTVSLTSGTLTASPAAGSSCTFSVDVAGTTAGSKSNTTGNVTSTESGMGATSNTAVLTVIAPPTIAKAFNPTTIALNATTSLQFTLTNPVANTVALTGVAFSDTLPSGLTLASSSASTCGGTLTTTAPTGVALTGATIAVNSPCVFSVTVTGATSGNYTNTTGAVSSTNGGTGNTASANLSVASPPAITKAFGATAIPLNGATSLTFSIANPNSGATLTGIAFTDSLPAGLVVATPNNLSNSCGGAATAVIGASSLTLSSGTLTPSASCIVSVNVTGATMGMKNNSVQVTSTEGGTGNISNASITVLAPPTIGKAFNPTSIVLNAGSTLSFTITNLNTASTLSGVGFTDNFPGGVVVAALPNVTGSCGSGAITATAGTSTITLTSGTLTASPAAGSSCTFSVDVAGTTAGSKSNTTGNVTSTESGIGATSNTAVLTVVAPPTIAKAFNPTTIALNATTSLQFTLTNPVANTVALTGVAFSDTLPSGLTLASSSASTCGGTLTTTAPTGIALTGATIAVNSPCVFSVTVTGATSGNYTNTTGAVSSTNGGTGNTASANLSVASPPAITKAFGAGTIPLNGATSLTFSVTNPNTSATLTGIAFTDNLPAGLLLATPSGVSDTCGGATTAVGGATSVSLSGGTLAASASCTVSVIVTGTVAGMKNNNVQVTSTEGGVGNTSNASITVVASPTISKAFGAASIPLNGSTSLSFTIQNNNATTTLTGIGFSDSLPAGLVISTPNGQTGTCGGATITATQATNVISLSGTTLAQSSSCTFSINVTGTLAGDQNNTTGNVTSANGGAGGMASASINVVAPPTIAKAFNPAAIALNGATSLTFTIANPVANSESLTGVAFTDTLPAGLTLASSSASMCGGTVTTTAPASIALSGAAIAINSQCVFSVTATGAASGNYTNTTANVTSANGGTGNTASANLAVATPPSISKAFGAASIGLANSTSLSFTITNPNSVVALTGVAFADTLPAGLVLSTPNGLTGTCGSGIVTATAGSQSISLIGGTIATSGSCTFSVNVMATLAGNQLNTTGSVSATNGGTGNTATASINVLAPDLTITKSHVGNFFQGQTGATYTLTVTNVGAGPTAGAVTVADTLPAGLSATSLGGTGWSCTLGTLSCTRNDTLAAGAGYPVITVTVDVAVNAAATITNVASVSGGGELNAVNDVATNITTVTLPPDFTLSLTPTTITINAGQQASYALTVTSLNNAFANTITFTASGLPPRTSIVFQPPYVTLSANAAPSTFVVSTSGGDTFVGSNSERIRAPLFGLLLPLAGLVLSGFGFRKGRAKKRWFLAVVILVCGGLGLYGCVGAAGNFHNLSTPPGTYTIIITATSGTLQHSTPVTLVIQP